MRIIKASKGVISVGKVGENLATKIQFDVKDWIEEFGEGIFVCSTSAKRTSNRTLLISTTLTEKLIGLLITQRLLLRDTDNAN